MAGELRRNVKRFAPAGDPALERLRVLKADSTRLTPAEVEAACGGVAARYGDEKVANRDTRVWHGATVNGP
jgi:hypothetical protein